MEVHAHSHTERKKWYHYFWEFFMLFLAVTLGFFVENQREHYIEHLREKQYMKSMVEDLKTDTSELKSSINSIENSLSSMDSMLLLLAKDTLTDENVKKSYNYTFPALSNIPVVFTDRTIAQLKNSGSMRMIRNQKVTDALTNYWNHIETIRITLSRHLTYRTKARDLETKIFNTAEYYLKADRVPSVYSGQIKLISHDQGLFREYANTIAYCGIILNGPFKEQMKNQYSLSSDLIQLIKKEYKIE